MAKISEYTRWKNLTDMIMNAIDNALWDEDIEEDDVYSVILLISPTLEEVYAYVNTELSSIDKRAFQNWHIEEADSIEEAVDTAGYYFDLR